MNHRTRAKRPVSTRRRSVLRRATCWIGALLGILALTVVTVVVTLRYADPPFTAFMLLDRFSHRPGETGRPLQHRWVSWDRISPHAAVAVLAAEDQKFPDHHGFDVDSIRSAIEAHLADDDDGGALRGASTISQQVAKNLFLWPARSWPRKGLEAAITGLIEGLWPKRRILEVYLNVAQFADDVYGVEAAARVFFGKPAAALTGQEAALMAAVLPNPIRLSIANPSAYVRKRQRWILDQMNRLGGTRFLERIER